MFCDMIKKKWNGYMTLEAALLYPAIFTIVVLLLYLGFFMYDRCLLESSAYIAALRGSRMQLMDNEEIYQETYRIAKELTNQRMFAAGSRKQSVKVSFDEVEVSYEAQVKPPVGTLLVSLTHQNYFKIRVKRSAKRIRPVTLIREWRRIEQLVNHGGNEEDE